VAGRHAGPVHLLVADVVMPHMNGRALAEELRRERTELRVLFTSGYPADLLTGAKRQGSGTLLGKPYDPEGLARIVREVLDR
jgi:DNA-binding NtrC family response regulator